MDAMLTERARRHAALGDPTRLAVVEDLATSDRSPGELARLLNLPTNLVAHHLDVLDEAGLITRFDSSADRRRRYVRLRQDSLAALTLTPPRPTSPVLFVCTRNSARSQLAAALWRSRTGGAASSAGTEPADCVHPGAIAAGERLGLDLGGATPRLLGPVPQSTTVVTVCDRAHEQLSPPTSWWHWSIRDPAKAGTAAAFAEAVTALDARIASLAPWPVGTKHR